MPFDCFNDKDDTKPPAGITLGVTLAYRFQVPLQWLSPSSFLRGKGTWP